MDKLNIPIYKGKKIDSDNFESLKESEEDNNILTPNYIYKYVEGYLEPSFDDNLNECWAIRTSTKRNPNYWGSDLHEIDPSTLEISFDSENWYSLEEAKRRINASYLAETICENKLGLVK